MPVYRNVGPSGVEHVRPPFAAGDYTAPQSFIQSLRSWADRDYDDIVAERHGPLDGFVEVSRFARDGKQWVVVQSTSQDFALELQLAPRGLGDIRAVAPERAWELARERDAKQPEPVVIGARPAPEPLPDGY